MDRTPVAAAPASRAGLWRNYALLIYTTLALVAVLVFANLILFDHNVRFDLTPTKRYTLSEFDKHVLDGLKSDVHVIAFIRTEDPSYVELEETLLRIAAYTPRVSYQVIDVNKAPGLARQYGVSNYGEVVVESEGRRRDFDNARPDLVVPALLQISHANNKKLYFTSGHGERDLFNADRNVGYSQWRNLLEQNNYHIDSISLLATDIPDDASLVAILGPNRDFLPDELASLGRYLTRGGHLLVMLDPFGAPSLADFLRKYHVDYIDQVIVDPAYRLSAGEILTTQIPLRSPDSIITRAMAAPAVFSLARGVNIGNAEGVSAPDGLQLQNAIVLLRSSHESWASGDDKAVTTGITEYQGGRDLKGPVPVAIEVDLAPAADAHEPISKMTRIIAMGDSDFASNQFFAMMGNRDLALNAINDLAGDDILIASRERVNQAGQAFFVSDQQARGAFMLGTVAEPLALFGIGVVVFVRRRFFS